MSIQPGQCDFPLYRWAGPNQNSLVIDFVAYDFTGATFVAQFREYRDQPGTPLISLTNAAANAEGVSVSVGTQTITPTDGTAPYSVTVSTVTLRVNETTVEGVLAPGSNGTPVGDKVDTVWDLQITTSGLGKVRWLEGNAPIYAGATQ